MSAQRPPRVLLTGSTGFLGSHVLDALRSAGVDETSISAPAHAELDLLDARACDALMSSLTSPPPSATGEVGQRSEPGGGLPGTLVIHCAAVSGGLADVRDRPGTFFHDNLAMTLNLLDAARRSGVGVPIERGGRGGAIVLIGQMTCYPADADMPMPETALFTGQCDDANAPLGVSKLAALTMLRAYHAQYAMRGVCVMPTNTFGPRDLLDPRRAHFIGAMVRRAVDATDRGDTKMTCWGTGAARRQFLFVRDAAEGVLAAARWALRNNTEPGVFNLAPREELTIRQAAECIAREAGFRGEILWDTTKPDGIPRRSLDPSHAQRELAWTARTGFAEGVRETIRWFRDR